MNAKLKAAAEELANHSHVDHVDAELDGVQSDMDDTIMVVLDWVTESHMEGNTRIIEATDYDQHIRRVSQAIRDLDGVRRTRSIDRMNGYVMFVEPDPRGDL